MRQAQRIRGKARAADRTRTPVICQLKKSMSTHKRQGKTRQANRSKRYMPKKMAKMKKIFKKNKRVRKKW